jgi:hypothetical protein
MKHDVVALEAYFVRERGELFDVTRLEFRDEWMVAKLRRTVSRIIPMLLSSGSANAKRQFT